MNRFKSKEYLTFCGLKEPEEKIEVVLASLAKRMGCSENTAASRLISKYRKGELGQVLFILYKFQVLFLYSNSNESTRFEISF